MSDFLPLGSNTPDRQRKALEFVRGQGSITSSQYQELFEVQKRQAQKDLAAMVNENLLIVEGRGPSTRYRVRDRCRIFRYVRLKTYLGEQLIVNIRNS